MPRCVRSGLSSELFDRNARDEVPRMAGQPMRVACEDLHVQGPEVRQPRRVPHPRQLLRQLREVTNRDPARGLPQNV